MLRFHRDLAAAAAAGMAGAVGSLWPPTAEEAEWMGLEGTGRLVPHDQAGAICPPFFPPLCLPVCLLSLPVCLFME